MAAAQELLGRHRPQLQRPDGVDFIRYCESQLGGFAPPSCIGQRVRQGGAQRDPLRPGDAQDEDLLWAFAARSKARVSSAALAAARADSASCSVSPAAAKWNVSTSGSAVPEARSAAASWA